MLTFTLRLTAIRPSHALQTTLVVLALGTAGCGEQPLTPPTPLSSAARLRPAVPKGEVTKLPESLGHLTPQEMVKGLPVFLNTLDGSRMVLFPPGIFQRGATGTDPGIDALLDEADDRVNNEVFLKNVGPQVLRCEPFLLDQTEVSAGLWEAFLTKAPQAKGAYPGAGDRAVQKDFLTQLKTRSPKNWGTYPMPYVTWNDARAYGLWARKELPTETQWEYAARFGHGGQLPWTEETTPEGVVRDRSATWLKTPMAIPPTEPVNVGPEGPGGLCHLGGNLAEWCEDRWCKDPVTPGGCLDDSRTIRGGSWRDARLVALSVFARTGHPVFDLEPRPKTKPTPTQDDKLAQAPHVGFRGARKLTDGEYAALLALSGVGE